jgi:hypothetical protein
MAVIPGVIPVTGFIGPTDDQDVYAVTDALYGVDGLRNVADSTARNAIPFERRRTGMIVGTQNNLKYWKLLPPTVGSPATEWVYDDTDWDLAFDLSVGPLSGAGSVSIVATVNSPSPTGSPLADEYSGLGTPTVLAYDVNVIYLITFDSNNTGAVRIDTDGLGLIEIKKSSNAGLIPLDADDIIAGSVNAVVYDGVQLQLLNAHSQSTFQGIKEHLYAGDDITVHADYQYLVYGNLTIDAGASLTNYGHVIIVNGGLVQNGTFNNLGNLHFVSLELTGNVREWRDSVLSIESDSGVLTPSNGDRYLVDWTTTALGEFAGHEGDIAICVSNASPQVWAFEIPSIGWSVFVDNVADGVYRFTGPGDTWVKLLFGAGDPSFKYVEPATAYLANAVNTITHGLGASDEIFITIIDTVTNEKIDAAVNNFATNSVDITFSQNVTAKIIIRS